MINIDTMIHFFKCSSIINISILTISSLLMMTSDIAYNMHTKLGIWSGSKETHKQIMYRLIGNYKILIIIFNIVPYFALCCCINNG